MTSDVKVGERVYALASRDGGKVQAFGGGTLMGENVVPKGRGLFGVDIDGLTNICIVLDTGERVFGHECYWGAEDSILEKIKGDTVELITIADYYGIIAGKDVKK